MLKSIERSDREGIDMTTVAELQQEAFGCLAQVKREGAYYNYGDGQEISFEEFAKHEMAKLDKRITTLERLPLNRLQLFIGRLLDRSDD